MLTLRAKVFIFCVLPFCILQIPKFEALLLWMFPPKPEAGFQFLNKSTVAWLESIRKKYDIPGLAVTIVASPDAKLNFATHPQSGVEAGVHNQILTFGSRNPNDDSLDENSLFCIASNTKLFTALSLGLLIERNTTFGDNQLLRWDTRMIDALPGWGLADEVAGQEATIEDLLTMRTGIPFHGYAPNYAEPKKVLKMMSHLPLSRKFRKEWMYNEVNYSILGHLISRVSQQPFPDFVKRNILEPLNMTSTFFDAIEARNTGNRTDAILRVGEEANPVSDQVMMKGQKRSIGWYTDGTGESMWGSAGLIMSSQDAGKWLQELLNPTLLSSSLLERCFTSHIPGLHPVLPETSNSSYGYGQWISYYRGHKIISHYGYQLGQHTLFARLPDHGIAIAVMNLWDDLGYRANRAVAYTILDELLGLLKEDWDDQAIYQYHKAKFENSSQVVDYDSIPSSSDHHVETLIGTFHHPAWGNLNFRKFASGGIDKIIETLLEEQTALPLPAFIAPMNGRENWYMLLHIWNSRSKWAVIQLHDEHTTTEIQSNAIIRVLGRGDAVITVEGMGMFDGFWSLEEADTRKAKDAVNPRFNAEVWFERVN